MNKKLIACFSVLVVLLLASCSAVSPGSEDSGKSFESNRAEAANVSSSYAYTDNVAPSQLPPGNLAPNVVPQFVTIGFDDNQRADGMDWIVNFMDTKYNPAGQGNPLTFDGTKAKLNFYFTGSYAYGANITAWQNAMNKGHEIGNHTQTHSFGLPNALDLTTWNNEIQSCQNTLTSMVNVPANSIYGFRTPFLRPSNATMEALKLNGFLYDCSIQEGFQDSHDGTNYLWPYTLDNGAPGNAELTNKNPIGIHSGLWEMGVRALIIPPDNLCAQYGVPSGLRAKIAAQYSPDPNGEFEQSTGKITGLDYTIWVSCKMTAAEALATLKYTFDLRYNGNRAPFMLGAHTDEYSSTYTAAPNATYTERRATIESFIDYVLTHPEVRIVGMKDIIDWMKNPVAVIGGPTRHLITSSVVPHTTTTPGETAPDWDASVAYVGGQKVKYDNKIWRAKWWTQNETPGIANVWEYVADAMIVTTEYYGQVNPAGNVYVVEGDTPTYTFDPDPNCSVKDVIIDGVSQGAISSYTFPPVNAPHEIIVEFQKL